MSIPISLSALTLSYTNDSGERFEQPLSDITSAGVLIDPDTGDDLELEAATIDVTSLRKELNDRLHAAYDDEHQHKRALTRTQLVFDLFYDDQDEPDVAVRDAISDLMHTATTRGVDFEQALADASRMWTNEREAWGLDD